MTPETLDLHELNHQYLLCLRDHALRDPASAAARFGVSACLVNAVTTMPLTALRSASQIDQVLFSCVLSGDDLLNLVRADIQTRSALAAITCAEVES
jgi:hypothetical protein